MRWAVMGKQEYVLKVPNIPCDIAIVFVLDPNNRRTTVSVTLQSKIYQYIIINM